MHRQGHQDNTQAAWRCYPAGSMMTWTIIPFLSEAPPMSDLGRQRQPQSRLTRLVRTLGVPALAAAVIAALPLASPQPVAVPERWTPMTPVSVTYGAATGQTAHGNLLSFNDFHGAVDAPTGSGGVVNGTPA